MRPIFIFPCGGRSGSTWLARLITSSKEVLVWAETHLFSYRFNHLNSIKYTYEQDTGKDTDLHAFRKKGIEMWTAALRPFEEDVSKNWALMMENLFQEAAEKEGFQRWGLKEVNWNVGDIFFIRKYWEDYRIIFLIRNFLDCYRSSIGTGWLLGDTGRTGFIQEWLRMASQITTTPKVKGKEEVFKYENINMDYFANWCGIKPLESISYVGSSAAFITAHDWELINNFLDGINILSRNLGYREITKALLYPEELAVI